MKIEYKTPINPDPPLKDAVLTLTKIELHKLAHTWCYLNGQGCGNFKRDEIEAVAKTLWDMVY